MKLSSPLFAKLTCSLLLTTFNAPLHSACLQEDDKRALLKESIFYEFKFEQGPYHQTAQQAFERLASIKVWEIDDFDEDAFFDPQKIKQTHGKQTPLIDHSSYETLGEKIPYPAKEFQKIMKKMREDLLDNMVFETWKMPFLDGVLRVSKIFEVGSHMSRKSLEEIREELKFVDNDGQERTLIIPKNKGKFKITSKNGHEHRFIIKKEKEDLFEVIEKDVPFHSVKDVLTYLLYQQKPTHSLKAYLTKRKALPTKRTYEQVKKEGWSDEAIIRLDCLVANHLRLPSFQHHCALDKKLLIGIEYSMKRYTDQLRQPPLQLSPAIEENL